MILSPASKNLFTTSFISYILFYFIHFIFILFALCFNPSLLNNRLAFGFLLNPDFLVSRTTQFSDEITIIPLLAFET